MARRRSKLDTEIQNLYGLPLGEFTAARNALAKQLKKGGDKEAADEVAGLPKPSVSAWAVNHLFTAAPGRMEELLESGERARKALREILSGGDPGALRDAIQEARELANELRDRAVDVLSKEGRPPGQAIVDRIATNLQSLAFSPAAEPVIERGWLDVDLPPPGFEVLAGLQLAATAPRPPKAPAKPEPAKPAARKAEDRRRDEQRKEEDRLKDRREREEARAREQREKEETRARERRERLEAQQKEKLARAQAARDEAAGRADFLRRKAEQAEKSVEELRQRLDEAERIAEDARKRAGEAEKELARADRAVRAAKG